MTAAAVILVDTSWLEAGGTGSGGGPGKLDGAVKANKSFYTGLQLNRFSYHRKINHILFYLYPIPEFK